MFCLFVCRFMPLALFLLIFQLVFAYKLTSDSSPLEEREHLFDIIIIRFLREKVKQINMWTEREITCAQCEHMGVCISFLFWKISIFQKFAYQQYHVVFMNLGIFIANISNHFIIEMFIRRDAYGQDGL